MGHSQSQAPRPASQFSCTCSRDQLVASETLDNWTRTHLGNLPNTGEMQGVSAKPRTLQSVKQPAPHFHHDECLESGSDSEVLSSKYRLDDVEDYPMARQVSYIDHVSTHERLETLFPMYTATAETILGLQSFVQHEDAVEKGIVQISEGQDILTFFWSHQWLSRRHPDPLNKQLKCMQGMLLKLREEGGVQELFSDSSHTKSASDIKAQLRVTETELKEFSRQSLHWIDYMCVPQADSALSSQRRAIMSICAYASQSHLMVVLCPRALHEETMQFCDLNSWRTRGWCRLELMAMVWTHESLPIIVCHEPGHCRIGSELAPKKMRSSEAPCNGSFSCCEIGHQYRGRVVLCDKFLVEECLRQLHKIRVSGVLRRSGRKLEWRWAKSMLPAVLAGATSSVADSCSTLGDFLQEYSLFMDTTDDAGNTALHWAALVGNISVVQAILASRYAHHVNARNKPKMREQIHQCSLIAGGGVTPLMLASERGCLSVVLELTDAKADVNAKAFYGATAVNLAATRGYDQCVKALLSAKADANVSLNEHASFFGHCVGFTSLHSACAAGHMACMRLLLTAEADPNKRSKFGATPLHCAVAMRDDMEIVQALLTSRAEPLCSCDADYPVESWRSATPYDIAKAHMYSNSASLLLKHMPLPGD